jgi:hypothetical protein
MKLLKIADKDYEKWTDFCEKSGIVTGVVESTSEKPKLSDEEALEHIETFKKLLKDYVDLMMTYFELLTKRLVSVKIESDEHNIRVKAKLLDK